MELDCLMEQVGVEMDAAALGGAPRTRPGSPGPPELSPIDTVLNLNTTSQKCEAVPRRARI